MVNGINNSQNPNIPEKTQILFGKKKSENIFSADSIFDKGINVSAFTGNSQKIASTLNTNENGSTDAVLDQNELNAFWNEVLLAAGNDGKLSDGEAKKLLKKYGLDKAGIQKEDLYKFLEDISVQGANVESSTIEQVDGKPVVVINYNKDESGNSVQERHNQDGTMTRTTTAQDGTVTTVELNAEGKKLKETKTTPQGATEETLYDLDDNGNEIPTKTTITQNNNSAYKLEIIYVGGEKASAVETNGQTMLTNYIFTEDDIMLMSSKTVNKDLPNELTTTYQYNGRNQIIYITEGENEYRCVPDADGNSVRLPVKEVKSYGTKTYEYDDNNTLLTSRFVDSKDGTVGSYVYANGDKNSYQYTETDKNGNVLILRTVEDGETVDGVGYDANGNTVGVYNTKTGAINYLMVQVDELSLSDIAQKFGVDVNELYEANKGNPHLKGKGANARFDACGANFVLPGKFDSSDQRLKGRQTYEEIRTNVDNVNTENRRRAEQAMLAQHERLMSRYQKYGLINTNGVGQKVKVSQWVTTFDGTKTYNPPLQVTIFGDAFDGGHIGQVKGSNDIVYIDKNGVVRDDQMTRRAVQTFAKNPSRAQTITINGKQIAVVYSGNDWQNNEIYLDSKGNKYVLSGGSIITEQQFDAQQTRKRETESRNIGIAVDLNKAITRNGWNDLGTTQFQTAFNKINRDNILEVLDLYRERNSESLPEAIMDEFTSTGNAGKCKQLINILQQRAQRAGMPASQLNSLYNKCINAANKASCTSTADLVSAINTFAGSITSFEMGGGRATNTSLGAATTEAAAQARADVNYQIDHQGWIGTAYEFSQIGLIIGDSRIGVRSDIQAFENKIKNLENIKRTRGQAAFEAAFRTEFGVPFSQQALNNYVGLKERYETALESKAAENGFQSFKRTVNSNNVDAKINDFLMKFGGTPAQKRELNTTINNTIQSFMQQGMSKKDAFNRFLDLCITDARSKYNNAVGGRSISQLGNAVKGSFDGMFGHNTGINETVAQYVDRQQAGEGYTLLGTKIVLAVGASCLNPALGAAVVTVGGTALDVSNDLTAKGDGYFGTRLTGDRLESHIVNNAENGALMLLGAGAEAYVANMGLTGAKKVITLSVLDAASGTTMEVLCKGDQVTIQGILYKVVFSAAGNAAQARLEKIGPINTKDITINTGDAISGIGDVVG